MSVWWVRMAQKKSCILNLNPDFTEPRTSNNPLKQTENESWCFVLFCLDSFSFLGIARSQTWGRGEDHWNILNGNQSACCLASAISTEFEYITLAIINKIKHGLLNRSVAALDSYQFINMTPYIHHKPNSLLFLPQTFYSLDFYNLSEYFGKLLPFPLLLSTLWYFTVPDRLTCTHHRRVNIRFL